MVSLWKDVVWETAEQLDLTDIELDENPFNPLFELLDQIFQREDLIEVPSRCEEFFAEFYREKSEEMKAYLMRHRTLMKKLKEVGVEVPKLLGGWHLLSRSGIPKWMFVQIKTMCNGELEYEKVAKALLRVFGGDHKPNAKDLARSSREENYFEDEVDAEEEAWYEEEMYGEWYGEGYEHEEYEDEAFYEEEIPEEVEEALDETEDAFVNYMESRRRMRELALSRGFYPIVALGPEAAGKSGGKSKGGKGSKGKGKGKSSGKGKGKGKVSGSTAQHGPRFKRYRLQSSGIKEVPEEQVSMVEETSEAVREECFCNTACAGEAIMDSGVTRTIVGEEVWRRWLKEFPMELQDIKTEKVTRDFRFGGGEVLRSQYDVIFRAKVKGSELTVQASVVLGRTPFLIARPTLEEWKVKQDFATGKMKIADGEWFEPTRGEKGHYVLKLLKKKETIYHVVSGFHVAKAVEVLRGLCGPRQLVTTSWAQLPRCGR